MRSKRSVLLAVAFALAGCAPRGAAGEREALWREPFDTLDAWTHTTFPKIPHPSRYRVVKEGTNSLLEAASNGSASFLTSSNVYDVTEYPRLRWRWRVGNVYAAGDAARKDGDDYALRVYVVFEYDPRRAGLAERARYRLAKARFGEYPPLCTLNYVWANRAWPSRVTVNPYTDRARMIALREGDAQVGEWVTEEVDVLTDYRAIFGNDPPGRASLAIMSDSDNTGEKSVSHVDFIEVLR